MEYNNYLLKNPFLSTKLIFLLLIWALRVHGALQEQPDIPVPIPVFKKEGFKTKEAFFFKEHLKVINDNFDYTGKQVCKELNSIIQAYHEQQIRTGLKNTHEQGNPLWETFSKDQYYQIISFPEQFSAYFQSQESHYKIKLEEFKQAKKFLFETIRLVKHESHIENALLKIDELICDLEKYTFENEETIAKKDDVITLKINYIQKKMLHIALIIEFKNQLFEFLESYFKERHNYCENTDFSFTENLQYKPQKLKSFSLLNKTEKDFWDNTLNINNYFSYLGPIIRTFNDGITFYNTTTHFIQDPKKWLSRKFFTHPTIQKIINTSERTIESTNRRLFLFADTEIEPLANRITVISNILQAGNKPAVWKFSTFLIKMVPRFIINRISNQPSNISNVNEKIDKNSKEVAEKIQKAFQEFEKTKKTQESLSKILKSLIKASGSFVPAIDFLNSIQERVFNNAIPATIAEYILEFKNHLTLYSNYIEEKIKDLNAVLDRFEIDKKIQETVIKMDSFCDWATIFQAINKNNRKKNRKNFYKPHLPLCSFLLFKKTPYFDVDENQFESIQRKFNDEEYQLISNHLNTIYTEINKINTDYLKKIKGIIDLPKTNIDLSIPDGYAKTMLFLFALKDVRKLYKYLDESLPEQESNTYKKENLEKFLLNVFPGTQNLKNTINHNKDSLKKLNNKKAKSQRAYNEAKNWLEHNNDIQEDLSTSIKSLDPSLSRKILTKIASYFIMIFSFFINKEKLLPFFDYSPFDEIILKEEILKNENKNKYLKKSVEKAIAEYEGLDLKIEYLSNIIEDKKAHYKAIKAFRNDIKAEINEFWNLN